MNFMNLKRYLFWLILISVVIRSVIAFSVEFGNDEVYYWTYALYPDLSHFDHPPMVGLVMQLFTLNRYLHSEFFIRLAAIFFCSVNTYLIFHIGKKVKDELTGFYSALLYTASIYCFIISGTFILPDSPQLFFWLLSIYFLINSVTIEAPDISRNLSVIEISANNEQRTTNNYFLFAGITIGLALLSKYTSAFLWFGALLYIIFYNLSWLRSRALYIAILISIILFIPVVIWNFNNHFISYSYHSGRVGDFHSPVRFDFFFQEVFGAIFYNNPFNFYLAVISIVALIKGRNFIDRKYSSFLLWVSLPLIFIVTIFSFFDKTLPHWTGPSYISLIIISAAWLSNKNSQLPTPNSQLPTILIFAMSFTLLTVILGFVQINYGIINFNKINNSNLPTPNTQLRTNLGRKDFSLDMYGWKQLEEKFSLTVTKNDNSFNVIRNEQRTTNNEQLISPSSPIVSNQWFPAANLDYYVAAPLHKKLFAIGDLSSIHKYFWINQQRGNLQKGSDAWFITLSTEYVDPYVYFKSYYQSIIPSDTIPISRNNIIVKYAFVYKLKNYIGKDSN